MKRFGLLFSILIALFCTSPLNAQQSRPPGYYEAEEAFLNLPTDLKIKTQVLLTAAGYWTAVPNENFSTRLFQAMRKFENNNGFSPGSFMSKPGLTRLIDIAFPNLKTWGFVEVYHPERPVSVWIPMGLGLNKTQKKGNLQYTDPKGRVSIMFANFSNLSLSQGFKTSMESLREEDAKINYSVSKPDFYAISYSFKNGTDGYSRFQADQSGVTGFFLRWQNKNGDVGGERIATLMSASLAASATGSPFIKPFQTSSSSTPAPKPSAKNSPSAPQNTPNTRPEPPTASSGTGFFVNKAGYILTNAHVVEKCRSYEVTPSGRESVSAKLIAKDATNDLALIKAEVEPEAIALIRSNAKLGESIAVFGYPLADVLSRNGNFTLGNITALAGLGDDSNQLQISAPVQQGNSGGPLVDQHGNLVGVIRAKLNAVKMASVSGDVPQNVNFAIKASVAINFMASNGVSYTEASPESIAALDPVMLAEKAKAISAFILCK